MRNSQHFIVLSNISTEAFFAPALHGKFLIFISYQEYLKVDYRTALKDADAVIVWLNIESMFPEIHNGMTNNMWKAQKAGEIQSICQDVVNYLTLHSNSKIYWILFEDYFLHLPMATGRRSSLFVEKINQILQEELSENITFIDLKYLIAELGFEMAFSAKNKFRWNFPYSKSLTSAVAAEIKKQYYIENAISPKCLVLDCDNVLWGGILSEEGIENIRLGSSGIGLEFQQFQRFVLSLYYRGVILAICSKNDLADILQVFREHSGMILREEHIACFQVNWVNKPENIRKIATKLNIGTESMVFVDDSPLELDAVKTLLPDVIVIPYHRENMYKAFSCFHLKDNPNYEEVVKRNETYRTESCRQEMKEKCDSYKDYLVALEMKVDIHKTLTAEYGRIAELTQRTNKCTNGVRWTVTNIKKLITNMEVHLYTVTLADKFADLGIVGVFGMRDNQLLLFSLSCRALGREIEDKMLEFIQARYRINKFDFTDTGKNRGLKLLLEARFGKREVYRITMDDSKGKEADS